MAKFNVHLVNMIAYIKKYVINYCVVARFDVGEMFLDLQ